MKATLADLLDTLPQCGTLRWIGLRPARKQTMLEPETAELDPTHGLLDDRYAGSSGKRQVSLVQQEHLAVVASVLGREVSATHVRRNLSVSGINLLSLKNRRFSIGNTLLEGTGLCHPCSRMEEILGPGGYNAMRGHGGITARVIKGDAIAIGDSIHLHLEA